MRNGQYKGVPENYNQTLPESYVFSTVLGLYQILKLFNKLL